MVEQSLLLSSEQRPGNTGLVVGASVGLEVGVVEGDCVGVFVGEGITLTRDTSASQLKLSCKPHKTLGFMNSDPGLVSIKSCGFPGMT